MARPDSKILATPATPAEETVVKQRKAPRAPTPEQQAQMPGGTAEQLAKAKLEAQEAKIKEPIGKKGLLKLNGRDHRRIPSTSEVKQRTAEIKKVLAVSRGPLTELENDIAKLRKDRAVADKEHAKVVTAHNKKLAVVDKQIDKLVKKAEKFSAAFAKTQAKADNQIAALTGQ